MATQIAPDTRHRAPLTRERVLKTAVELADRDGIESVSMRRLGQALGVEAMSLYNHVAGKEDLLDGMVDVIVSEIDPSPADGRGRWKKVARRRILSARQTMLRHPWAAGVIATRTQASTAVLQYMDSMGGILQRGGFSVDLMHHSFHVLGSRILGFSQELFDDSGEPQDAEVQAVMLKQMTAVYPNITAIMAQVAHDEASIVGAGCDDQFEFEFALDLILEGLERLRKRTAS